MEQPKLNILIIESYLGVKKDKDKEMKKLLNVLIALTSMFAATSSTAAVLVKNKDRTLLDHGGVLDRYVGLQNLQKLDHGNGVYWSIDGTSATVTSLTNTNMKEQFGVVDEQGYTYLINARNKPVQISSDSVGERFSFSLFSNQKRKQQQTVSEKTLCTPPDCLSKSERMSSWQIIDGKYEGDYIIAWQRDENEKATKGGDLVFRVSGVTTQHELPIPASVWLFVSGLLGIVTVKRRSIEECYVKA